MHWVIETDRGMRIVESHGEPDTAIYGPYQTHDQALAKLLMVERIQDYQYRWMRGLMWIAVATAAALVVMWV